MSRKPARDPNVAAFNVLQQITGERITPKKRRAKAGGEARKEALSPERRKEIAQKAAAARWKRKS